MGGGSPGIGNSFDSCTKERAENITFALMQFLAAHALAFSLVESVFFIAFLRTLNSAYPRYLPKADAFRRTWLPKLLTSTKVHISNFFENTITRRTLAFDGFKTIVSHVIIVVEVIACHTGMCEMIDPEVRNEDASFYATEMERIMRARAAEAGKTVEEVYCAVVADNVLYNR